MALDANCFSNSRTRFCNRGTAVHFFSSRGVAESRLAGEAVLGDSGSLHAFGSAVDRAVATAANSGPRERRYS